jgi:hypothetical protein
MRKSNSDHDDYLAKLRADTKATEARIRAAQRELHEGARNGTPRSKNPVLAEHLLQTAREARADRLSRDEALDRVRQMNTGDAPLPETELARLVEVEYRVGTSAPTPRPVSRKVRVPDPYQPFPVEALPAPLDEFVRQGALALGCDPAYLALPALAVAAGLIGHTRVLRLKRTWRVPCVLWTVVIADSGTLKTPAFRLATDHLFTLQRRLDLEFKRALAAYAKAKEEWQAAAAAAKEAGREPPDKPEPPVHRSVFTSDATIEAIAELIGDNPRGLTVACDELAGWLGSFARYKGKAGGTDLQRWLSMHSAGGFAYHRRTGDKRRIVVPHAAVSVCGGIQPGILTSTFGDDFLAAGLAARLLMAVPPRRTKTWTELELPPEVEEGYRGLLDKLFALDQTRDGEGHFVPHAVRLDPDAHQAWVDWYKAWAREQAVAEGELASALAKLEEAAARFALLHHIVSRVARGEDDLAPVGRASVEAGIRLSRWFAARPGAFTPSWPSRRRSGTRAG